jgi:hypothetical protein
MKGSKLTALVAAIVVVCVAGIYLLTGVSIRNEEASLRAQFAAVQSANTVDYDAMWKIIGQTAQVPAQYSKDFRDAYTSILSGNGAADNGTVRNLFAVAAGMRPPQLDPSIYRKVQDVIESERTKFANAQKQLLDIKREHDRLRTTFPGSMFVGAAAPLEAKLVTSSRTEKAFDSGKDDDTDLFGKRP